MKYVPASARFGVNVTLDVPKVAYRETITGKAAAEGRHVRQSGGHGQYGVVNLEVEPRSRGEGFEFVDKIKGGWLEFDAVIATPDMMRSVGQLGKVLGPRGLMPNPKTGTVTFDVKTAVQETKAGKIEYRVDKTGVIHVPVGKVSFEAEKIQDNARTLLDAVVKAKPSTAKGKYVKKVNLAATMGPGVLLDEMAYVK